MGRAVSNDCQALGWFSLESKVLELFKLIIIETYAEVQLRSSADVVMVQILGFSMASPLATAATGQHQASARIICDIFCAGIANNFTNKIENVMVINVLLWY